MSVAACGGGMGGGSDDEGNDKRMRVHVDHFSGSSDADDEESDEEGEITDYKVERRNLDLRKLTLNDSHPSLPAKNKRKISKHYTGFGRSRSSDSLKQVRPATKKRRISPDDIIYTITRGESDTKLKVTRSSSAPPAPARIPALPPEEAQGTDTDVENDKNLPVPRTPIGVVKKKYKMKSMKEINKKKKKK